MTAKDKYILKTSLVTLALFCSISLGAQGLLNATLNNGQTLATDNTTPLVECGSYRHMEHIDQKQPGYIDASNAALQNFVKSLAQNRKSSSAVLTVPVVFHIVHNNPGENLQDSVINSQLAVLNQNFRRQNADTGSLRTEFRGLVDDARIEFKLATTDPTGNPTNGITRTATTIEHFGGILPYSQNQTAQIQQWVNDSLFYNFYRLTKTNLGGIDAWDTERFFNIWIGDLRILEPQINNLEELFLLGIATPPVNHPNFAGTGLDSLLLEQGALMHYVAIGPNNPNQFPAPYGAFNNIITDGDLLTHEAGHYLGLRHIWGDGDCTADDFIFDTPLSNASGQFTCNKVKNTCTDTIGGVDLKDMVENYMDYSSDACLNSFTKQQIAVMRGTLQTYRTNLFTVGQKEFTSATSLICYPNPSKGMVNIESSEANAQLKIKVYSLQGKLLQSMEGNSSEKIQILLNGPQGVYLIQVESAAEIGVFRVMKKD
jgi:hypothetical protein